MICMVYRVTVAPGRREDYLREFELIRDEVHQQKGCIEYDIYIDSTDPRFNNVRRDDIAVIAEKWESIEDLQEHTRSLVMAGFRERIQDLKLASDYELLVPYHSNPLSGGVK